MMIDKGYMNPDRALETLPKKEEEKSFLPMETVLLSVQSIAAKH